jgi:hypothetical protein
MSEMSEMNDAMGEMNSRKWRNELEIPHTTGNIEIVKSFYTLILQNQIPDCQFCQTQMFLGTSSLQCVKKFHF